jgi:hypothetical protein
MAEEAEPLSCSDKDLKRQLHWEALNNSPDPDDRSGGELLPMPFLSPESSIYKIGDMVVYKFPQRAREHSEAMAEFRGTGRIPTQRER